MFEPVAGLPYLFANERIGTVVPNAGHLPHVERAAAVAQAMQTFLRN